MASLDSDNTREKESWQTAATTCDPCRFNGFQQTAVDICEECEEKYCSACSGAHKGQKISSKHVLMSVANTLDANTEKSMPLIDVFCKCSKKLQIEFFCRDHDDVLCKHCVTIQHPGCKTVNIVEDGVEVFRDKLKSLEQTLSQLDGDIDEITRKCQFDLKSLDLLMETATSDVQDFKQEINSLLEVMEQNTLKRLKKLKGEKQKEIDEILASCSSTKRLLQTDMKLFDESMKAAVKPHLFVVCQQILNRLETFDRLVQTLREGAIDSPSLTFERDSQLDNLMSELSTLGSLSSNNDPSFTTESVLELQNELSADMCANKPVHLKVFNDLDSFKVKQVESVAIKLEEDEEIEIISGCCVMPNGKVVLCDKGNSKLKLLDKDMNLLESLELEDVPFDVSPVSDTTILVTLPGAEQLQYIEVEPKLKCGRIIQTDTSYWGIDVVDDVIYVTAHRCQGFAAGVRILDKDGNSTKAISLNKAGNNGSLRPNYLTVNPRSNRIYVSDAGRHTTTCLTLEGDVIYRYTDPELSHPQGLLVDFEDNVLICCNESSNVHLVSADGTKQCIILTNEDGVSKPLSISHKHDNGAIIIGCMNENLLLCNFKN